MDHPTHPGQWAHLLRGYELMLLKDAVEQVVQWLHSNQVEDAVEKKKVQDAVKNLTLNWRRNCCHCCVLSRFGSAP
ncbi:hypothetical protein L2E82_06243 [Cichorium intybus]|uniref:Uncharacterized protein n=1 Tax=Cichorium intybus TaxID=13427 RepID=A0ACB9HA28_CICIN|nr:hypothetical protein L2E82_06243 [Cichorium intybus]